VGTEYARLAVTDSPLTLTIAMDEDLSGISEEKRPFSSKVFSSVPMDTQLPPEYPLCTGYPMVRFYGSMVLWFYGSALPQNLFGGLAYGSSAKLLGQGW